MNAWKDLYGKDPYSDSAIRNESLHNNPKLLTAFNRSQTAFLKVNDITKIHHVLKRDRLLSEEQLSRITHGPLPRGLMDKLALIIPPPWPTAPDEQNLR